MPDEELKWVNEMWNEGMDSLIKWENEIRVHNETILEAINYDPKDFNNLLDNGYVIIIDKMQWVDEPTFKPQENPENFGVFTLTHVDQWCVNMEGDSFNGFMYVKVKGFDKHLKIPYSC